MQIEYAMQASSNAGLIIGIRTDEGVIMAAERKILSKVGIRSQILSLK